MLILKNLPLEALVSSPYLKLLFFSAFLSGNNQQQLNNVFALLFQRSLTMDSSAHSSLLEKPLLWSTCYHPLLSCVRTLLLPEESKVSFLLIRKYMYAACRCESNVLILVLLQSSISCLSYQVVFSHVNMSF